MKNWRWFILGILLLGVPLRSRAAEVNLLAAFPSDPQAFTQGLEMSPEGKLTIGTGGYGSSSIGYLNLKTGQVEKRVDLPKAYFGEGITWSPDYLYQLSWREGSLLIRHPHDLRLVDKIPYQGEGWGLAYDSESQSLWMSDGSNKIYQRDLDNFAIMSTLDVKSQGRPINRLNELEWVDGFIFANVWYTMTIIKIDTMTGQVVKTYDIQPLIDQLELSEDQLAQMDSLNGIAHIEGNRFYLTGKLYPVVMEVELME
ncbi:glutaminyl-peptide cyclotransferase [Hutsoniella sourekii]|uniref:glutaminyl-peptide cyclotransferase n=1 Tax=Hutsoniella sourekii TaxID=87650 RepID=UPI00047F61D3|nr:glutaminyl-peptide cyclotransferase [Hutsoniella sourekii]